MKKDLRIAINELMDSIEWIDDILIIYSGSSPIHSILGDYEYD